MSDPKLEFLGKGCEHYIDLSKITDKSVMVDAGCCTGTFIERIRKFTNAKIYAIECAKNNLHFLNEKNFDNIEIEEKALVGLKGGIIKMAEFKGTRLKPDGTPQYHRWANLIGNHKEKFKNDPETEVTEYEVEALTMGDLISKYDLKQIDFFKVDIEGSEYEVFENMSMDHAKIIKQMSIEVHIPEKDAELVKHLEYLGFKTIKSGPNELYAYRED
jgi:FkbM family methyltransferase